MLVKKSAALACEGGHANVLRTLIDRGVDVNHLVYKDRSPLLLACERGDLCIARMLVELPCTDVNLAHGATGKTPLIAAAELVSPFFTNPPRAMQR